MEAPIWKPSYRLDMGNTSAAFQAWAIIDNSTDLDWKDVKLTLTSGRPVGFRQNLYEPYYTERETIPILAGQTAGIETFDSAYDEDMAYEETMAIPLMEKRAYTKMTAPSMDEAKESSYFENQTIAKSNAGEMFAFSPVKPVNLPRQKSTMIPLSLASLPAQKYSVFSSIPYGSDVHPKLCISIENNSGLKFPAGPITVFENGEYSGDAILEFLPENEKERGNQPLSQAHKRCAVPVPPVKQAYAIYPKNKKTQKIVRAARRIYSLYGFRKNGIGLPRPR